MYSCYLKKHIIYSYDDKRYVKVLFIKMRIMDSEYHDNNNKIDVYEICTENVIKLIACL